MGRAARRAQERAERRQRQQQTRPPRRPSVTMPQPVEGQRRSSLFKPRWALDIISELRKVTWPSRAETTHLTLVVIVVSLIFGVVLGVADFAFGWLIEQTILR